MARPRTICLLLALITVLAYSPVRNAAFVVFDDPDYVADPHVEAGLTVAGVKWAFTTWHASNWFPLTWLSLMLDGTLFGPKSPGPEHLVNVLFHTANTLLLFWFLFRATKKLWPATFVAALFAWHPLRVESVAWVTERKDVLSTFFGLLALLAYVNFATNSKPKNPKSKAWYVCALILFALSLMAKPMLVTLPFALLLLDVWPLERFPLFTPPATDGNPRNPQPATRNTFALILEKIPFLALTVGSCIVTFLAQRAEAVVSLEQRPVGLRIANALISYVEYLAKAVWPAHLAIIYPLPNQIPVWQIVGAAVFLILISALVWFARKGSPYLIIGWLWYLGTLVPVIGLVQVGGQAFADRYTYLPLIGISIALAYSAAELISRFRISAAIAWVTAALVLIGCLVVTEYQIRFWQNSIALFSHALAVTKDNAIAHINLGVALEEEPTDRRTDALREYQTAIQIDPNRLQAHNNLANLQASMGQRDEALKEYQEALRLNPNAAMAHANQATLLAEMGRFDDSMREFAEATRLTPGDPRLYYLMGKACLRHGQSAEAIKHFRESMQLQPNDFQTITWLARVLAADEDSAVRNGTEAVSLAARAVELTGGQEPLVLDTLAMAYAEAGRFKEAQDAEQNAIDLATAAKSQKTISEMQQRLQLYQAGKPSREDFKQVAAVTN